MKSELSSELQQALRNAVEKSVGQKMNTPKDFDILAHRISMSTHKYVSPTTLKRFWHYLEESENYVPRLFTLDLLSMFVGYQNWDAYCQFSTANKTIHSDFVKSPNLYTTSLIEGDMLNLMWTPDRCVTIKYMGEDLFEVIESVNSKLKVGDRFCCGCFIEREALYLTRLVRDGKALGAYVCGKEDGIKFTRVYSKENQ